MSESVYLVRPAGDYSKSTVTVMATSHDEAAQLYSQYIGDEGRYLLYSVGGLAVEVARPHENPVRKVVRLRDHAVSSVEDDKEVTK